MRGRHPDEIAPKPDQAPSQRSAMQGARTNRERPSQRRSVKGAWNLPASRLCDVWNYPLVFRLSWLPDSRQSGEGTRAGVLNSALRGRAPM